MSFLLPNCKFLIILALLMHASSVFVVHAQIDQQQLSNATIFDLLQELRSKGFLTGATILSYIAKPFLVSGITLLIPTDMAIADAAVNLSPKQFPPLIEFHILERNLKYRQLRLFPVGTWLPTALPGYGVEVTSNTAGNYSFNNAQIIKPDLCSNLRSALITCQGISSVLNPNVRVPPLF